MSTQFPAIAFLALKIFVLIGLAVYGLFAAVMVRQEQLMEHVIEEKFEPLISLIVLIHLILSIGVFILALIIL